MAPTSRLAIIFFFATALTACGGSEKGPPLDPMSDASMPDSGPDCAPGLARCDGQTIETCSASGVWERGAECDGAAGALCQGGGCVDACEQAESSKSYIGCEYLSVITPNPVSESFSFALVVGNPNPVAAEVTVHQGDRRVSRAKVDAGSVATIFLPWVPTLKGGGLVDPIVERDGAYRVASTLPVYAYQFNPLEYASGISSPSSSPTEAYSFTNDASLLLPVHTLGDEYLALSRRSFDGASGFVSIVAAEDDTQVTFTSSARTRSGEGVEALMPGETQTFELDAGDVVQILSRTDRVSDHTDLTGSRVVSDKPIAVFGGHQCTFIPDEVPACDHLEEQVLPLETWGRAVVAVSTQPLRDGEVNYWRVVSGTDDNAIAFEPSSIHEPVTLDAGEFVEVGHAGGFRVAGSGRVGVAQFMVGQGVEGNQVGDPSMGQGIPEEQLRSSYVFLVPSTYTRNWMTVFAPIDTDVRLDGMPIGALEPIEGTTLGFSRVIVGAGGHRVESEGGVRFGLTLYGVAAYTSYLYPGGLDLEPIPLF